MEGKAVLCGWSLQWYGCFPWNLDGNRLWIHLLILKNHIFNTIKVRGNVLFFTEPNLVPRLWFSRALISTTTYFLSNKTFTRPNLWQKTKHSSGVIWILMKTGPISHLCHSFLLGFLKAKVGSGGDVTLWGKTCQALGMMRFCSQLNSSKLTFLPMAKCSCACRNSNFLTWWKKKKCLRTGIWGQIPQWRLAGLLVPPPVEWDLQVWEKKGMEMWRERLNPGRASTASSFCSLSFPSHQLPHIYIIFRIWPSTFFFLIFFIPHVPGNKRSLSQPGLHSWHTIAPDLSFVSWAPDSKASNVNFLMNANDIQLHFSFQTFYPWGAFCTQTIFQISITEWIANTCNYQNRSRSDQFSRLQQDLRMLLEYLLLI